MTINKKIAQLSLISIGIFLILLTYFSPLFKEKVAKDVMTKTDIIDSEERNTFENIEYKGIYNIDKPFSVKSEKAYILKEDPDVVYMNNMYVTLYLKDERTVNIISDKGKYNKVTHDCFFEENVVATDGETKIFAENLDLLATKNFAKVYNNVKLNHPMGVLDADKIDYDLETKYFKVSMFNDETVKMKIIE